LPPKGISSPGGSGHILFRGLACRLIGAAVGDLALLCAPAFEVALDHFSIGAGAGEPVALGIERGEPAGVRGDRAGMSVARELEVTAKARGELFRTGVCERGSF